MTVPWIEIPITSFLFGIACLGGAIGLLMDRWGVCLSPLPNAAKPARTRWISALTCATLFALLSWGIVGLGCQSTPMVAPSAQGWFWRISFQLALVALLWATVITDLRDYLIPDPIIIVGLAIGLGGQFASGELQIQHIWIDWNGEIPGIKGADVPAWIDEYRRLHGLTVGFVGASVGASVTWSVRALSSKMIGQETMGLGDVTLMAMIGSFLGWQPVLFVFLLAPLCGVVASLVQQFLGGKHYLPYGPFLALATFIVLMSWRWIWMPLRYVFGHIPTLLGLMGGASAAFILLLILARMYRSIPIRAGERYTVNDSE